MSTLARDYLSISASSASPERLFSLAAEITTADRQRLTPKSIEELTRAGSLLKDKVKPIGAEWAPTFAILDSIESVEAIKKRGRAERMANTHQMEEIARCGRESPA